MAAKALLSSIQSESGNQLLQSVRYYTNPPGSTFFAPLDTILENYDPKAAENSVLNRGDVIEIQGPAASGKTQMLQFFAMTTCLPRSWEVALSVRGSSRPPRMEEIAIGGRANCCAVLDCDGRFSIDRLYQLVRSHLARRVQEHAATIPALYSAEADPDALHEETLKALTRVHVFSPTSSISLAASVLSLPAYVQKNCSEELTFVLLDNISAFYWQDRFQAEQDKVSIKGKQNFSGAAALRNTLSALNQIRQKLGCVVVLTNWAFPGAGDVHPTPNSPFFRQHLPKPYPSPFVKSDDALSTVPAFNPSHPIDTSGFNITHHITLHGAQYKAVSKNTSLENTLKEEPFRSMDQQEIGSMAFVRIPGVEEGEELGRWELVVRQNVIDGL